jgi:hypothetical protein
MVEPLARHCLRIPTRGTPVAWHREKVGLRATVGDAKLLNFLGCFLKFFRFGFWKQIVINNNLCT